MGAWYQVQESIVVATAINLNVDVLILFMLFLERVRHQISEAAFKSTPLHQLEESSGEVEQFLGVALKGDGEAKVSELPDRVIYLGQAGLVANRLIDFISDAVSDDLENSHVLRGL